MNALRSPARMHDSMKRRIGAAILLVLSSACTTIETPLKSELESASPALRSCANWFEQLDAAIDRAGVRDAGAHRIPGFPYLRADRFSASFRDRVKDDPRAFDAWLGRLKALDADARDYEIENLPAQSFPLAGAGDKAAARATTQDCAAQLAREDLGSAAERDLLVVRAKVPDSYSDRNRVLGLYPIASIPFSKGVAKWQQETVEAFARAGADTGSAIGVVRYASAARPVTGAQVAVIFSQLSTDALGIPQLTDEQRDLLFRAYAPAYAIETTGDYDRFGPLSWRGRPAPDVDSARPVAYRRLAYTRYHGKTLVQLVYTIWFPQRPHGGAADLLAGRLDGVVFRVTLGTDGVPLVYDTMHPCGCYHMFFPTARVKPLPAPQPLIEWAFVPLRLPAVAAAQRVLVRIESRTHYVVDVRPDTDGSGVAYQFADEDGLRALPAAHGGTRSAFGPDGIVPGTERGERFLYWPMGIYDAGAMRQWGNHATAFIGRSHFDDADLIERRFELVSGGQSAFAQPR